MFSHFLSHQTSFPQSLKAWGDFPHDFCRCIESMCRLVCWNHVRLVVSTPLKNMSLSVGMMKFHEFPNIRKNKKNMFQTTNQICVCVLKYVCFHVCYTVIPLHLKMEFGTRSHSSRKYVPTQMWNVIICLAIYTACWHVNHWSVAPPKLFNRKNLNSRILNHPSVY